MRDAAIAALRAAICLAAGAISGCGNGQRVDPRDLFPVSGTIVRDGQPVASGDILFLHTSGRMAEAQIRAGRIVEVTTLIRGDGLLVGTHRVAVNARDKKDESVISSEFAHIETSGLTIEVRRDEPNEFDIELSD